MQDDKEKRDEGLSSTAMKADWSHKHPYPMWRRDRYNFVSSQTPAQCIEKLEKATQGDENFQISINSERTGHVRFNAKYPYPIGNGTSVFIRADGTLSPSAQGGTQVMFAIDRTSTPLWTIFVFAGLMIAAAYFIAQRTDPSYFPLMLIFLVICFLIIGRSMGNADKGSSNPFKETLLHALASETN